MRARFFWKMQSVVLSTILLGVGLFWAPAAFATTTAMNIPITGASVNGCVPPGTYVSGHLHVTFRVNIDPLKGTHMGMESNTCGSKIVVPDLDGELVEFVSNETQFNQFNLNLNGATEYTAHHSFKYVSPGKRENYRLDVEVHVTVNANGEITAEFERVYIDCYVQCCGGEVVE